MRESIDFIETSGILEMFGVWMCVDIIDAFCTLTLGLEFYIICVLYDFCIIQYSIDYCFFSCFSQTYLLESNENYCINKDV